jgi:hypothetical protein
MNDDGLGDWRIEVVMQLAEDVPPAYPGGPSHKAGVPVYLVWKKFNDTFVAPSGAAMALNISIRSSKEALALRSVLTSSNVITPDGIGKAVRPEDLTRLYDFFEYCMSAAIFSFHAIEAFANWEIGRRVKDPLNVIIDKKEIEMSAYEIQRELSTADKIDKVLPNVFNLSSPKGTKVWQDFKKLKIVRDSTVHLKLSKEQIDSSMDRESLFFDFLNSPTDQFPRYAYNVISYFLSNAYKPRWFNKLEKIIGDR